MAYITKQEVSVIRENLKREFPAFRFTLSGGNSSKLNVVIKSGPVRFIKESEEDVMKGRVRSDINHHYAQNYEYSEVLKKIIAVCLEKHWDDCDAHLDYFNTAFYFSISQGTYDKPYTIRKADIHTTAFYIQN